MDRVVPSIRNNVSLPSGGTLISDAAHFSIMQDIPLRSAASGGRPPSKGRIVREFEKQGDKWMLKHVRSEVESGDDHRSSSIRSHLTFSTIKFYQNHSLDAQRAVRRAKNDTSAAFSGMVGIGPQV